MSERPIEQLRRFNGGTWRYEPRAPGLGMYRNLETGLLVRPVPTHRKGETHPRERKYHLIWEDNGSTAYLDVRKYPGLDGLSGLMSCYSNERPLPTLEDRPRVFRLTYRRRVSYKAAISDSTKIAQQMDGWLLHVLKKREERVTTEVALPRASDSKPPTTSLIEVVEEML